jgi:WD40 repeat protein
MSAFSAGEHKIVRWDLVEDRELGSFDLDVGVVEITRVSPDGRFIAIGVTEDPRVFVFEAATGRRVAALTGHEQLIETATFSPDSKRLATGSRDRSVRLWEIPSGMGRVLGTHGSPVNSVEFFPNSQRVAVADQEGVLRVYDAAGTLVAETGGHGVPEKSAHPRTAIWTIAVSPDGQRVASCGVDTTVRVWDAELRPVWRAPALVPGAQPELFTQRGWQPLGASPSPLGPSLRRQIETTTALAAFDRDARAACLIRHDGKVERWDVAADRVTFELSPTKPDDVAVLGDGCLVLAAGNAFAAAPDATHLLMPADAIATDTDGALVAAGTKVAFFSPDGTRQGERTADRPAITALLRTNGQVFLGHTSGEIERLGGATFESRAGGAVLVLAAGPAGSLVAGHADGLLSLWDGETGRQLTSTRLHGRVLHAVVSANRLFAATDLGDLFRLDLASLALPACDVLRQVWRSVPIVWEGDGFVRRPPPRGHVCAGP